MTLCHLIWQSFGAQQRDSLAAVTIPQAGITSVKMDSLTTGKKEEEEEYLQFNDIV